jgi:peptidoglycan/LPS O-acetylase OafA/YrhL
MSAPDAPRRLARPSATGRDRVVGLDGLRAVAVLLVMGFHFGVGWLQGGFFGVDVFYVLSGYLITGLLVAEYRRGGRIRLSAFWLRRARRLLPALVVVLVVVTLLLRFDEPAGLYPDYRMSALSALFYFSNWWQIAVSGNYFVATGPAYPLTHTWSLAVEEQFYLVWPFVVLAVMRLARTVVGGIRALLVLSLAGAVASAAEMALLYDPSGNTTRVYFGTDTHAQSILVGSVLACGMTIVQMRRGEEGMDPAATSRRARGVLVVLGVAGLAGLVALSSFLEGSSSLAYRGGFALGAVSAAAVIAAVVCVRAGPLARVLSLRPLVWLGTISYGAYLWHYPVFVFVDDERTGLSGPALLGLRSAATLGLAAASFVLVERPIVEGTFWRSVRAVVPATAVAVATVAVIMVATIVPASAAIRVHPYREGPVGTGLHQVVVLGDSTALALGYALAATAPAGVRVVNGGLFGCGLVIATEASNDPSGPGTAMVPDCNSSTPPARQWPALDVAPVAGTARGDLVLFVAGLWETQDLLRNGHWTSIEQPSFRRYEQSQMRTAVRIGTAHGAHFDFATMPVMDEGTTAAGAPVPGDSPRRRQLYDGLVREVAAEYPGKVSVIDYGGLLSPRGVFTTTLDGVQVRAGDGIHTPVDDPGNVFADNVSAATAHAFDNWLSPRLWPLLVASVTPTDRSPTDRSPTGDR